MYSKILLYPLVFLSIFMPLPRAKISKKNIDFLPRIRVNKMQGNARALFILKKS